MENRLYFKGLYSPEFGFGLALAVRWLPRVTSSPWLIEVSGEFGPWSFEAGFVGKEK